MVLAPAAQADVINRGFGGYQTSWLAMMGPALFAGITQPRLLLLFVGLKDSKLQSMAGYARGFGGCRPVDVAPVRQLGLRVLGRAALLACGVQGNSWGLMTQA